MTVRVTDNGSPPLVATQTFTIDVLQPTSLALSPARGTYGAATALSATLTAGSSPLAGAPVTFFLAPGGQATTLGTTTTDANGVASLSGVDLAGLSAGRLPFAVMASFGGDTNDAPAVAGGGLAIAQATPIITWATPADITQGQALGAAQLDATASVAGTFTYSPAAGTVLSAGMGQGLTALFTPTDSTDYTGAGASATINVLPKPTPTVALGASTLTPLAGLPLTIVALVTPPTSGGPTPTGTVRFELDGNPLGTTVALVDGAATSASITLTDGAHTITAVYSGDSTYASAPDRSR